MIIYSLKQNMQKTKFLSLILFMVIFSFSFVLWDNAQTLSDLLEQERNGVMTLFNSSVDSVEDIFDDVARPVSETTIFKSLICLGAISTPIDSSFLEAAKTELKNDILQEYIRIYWKVKWYELWLYTDFTWIKTEIQYFPTIFTPLINKYKSDNLVAISWMVQEVRDYTNQNAELLTTVSNRITKIQWAVDMYTDLNEDINDFQKWLSSSQQDFYQKLQNAKSVSYKLLDSNLQNQIDKIVKRYKKLPWLQWYLLSQKQFSLDSFNDYAQTKINEVFGVTYDEDIYSQINESVQSLKSQFYNWDSLNCTNILSNYQDTSDIKISNIIRDINSFKNWLSVSWSSISTWLSTSAQITATNAIKSFYATRLSSDLKDFRSFINQKLKELYNQYINIAVETPAEENKTINLDIPEWFSFVQAFTTNQVSDSVAVLQQILSQLWLYSWTVNWIYDSLTKNAVYNMQLQNWLLKWYENKPSVRWRLGPTTRAFLNKLIN